MNETSHAINPFHINISLLLSYQLPKIFLHFQNKKKKSLMKPDTIDFKSLLTFPATTIPPTLSSNVFK